MANRKKQKHDNYMAQKGKTSRNVDNRNPLSDISFITNTAQGSSSSANNASLASDVIAASQQAPMSEPAIAATTAQTSVQQEQQVTVISQIREAQQLPMVASSNALQNKPASKQSMSILPNLNKRHKNLAPTSRRTPNQLNAALSFQATQEDLKKMLTHLL